MTCKTLLVNITGRDIQKDICAFGASLAERIDAQVIGIAGVRLFPPFSEVPVAESLEFERQAAEQFIAEAEICFRKMVPSSRIAGWRSFCDYNSVEAFIAREARAADLIVTSAQATQFLERAGELSLGALVLKAGRPVLIAPRHLSEPRFGRALIAWKDCREARRAVADALPLLRKSSDVTVLQIASSQQAGNAFSQVKDVVAWLNAHSINARPVVETSKGSDTDGLEAFIKQNGCDLLVAGAYAHTRLSELFFGGVTQELLLPASRCTLVSH